MPAPTATVMASLQQSVGLLLDLVPKGKKADALYVLNRMQGDLSRVFNLLSGFRQYILDNPDTLGGEESPFVEAIDGIVPRQS